MGLRAYLFQGTARLLPQALAFGVSIALARTAGISVVGQYGVAISVAALTFGLVGAAVDTNALRRADLSHLPAAVGAKVAAWLVMFPLMLAGLHLLSIPLFAGSLFYVGVLFMQLAEMAIIEKRLSNKDAQAILPRTLPILVFLGCILVVRPHDLAALSILFAFSWILVLVFTWRMLHGAVHAARAALGPLRSAALIVGTLLLTQIYGNADLLLVKWFMDDTSAGYYRLAQAMASIVMPAIGVVSFIYLSELQKTIRLGSPAQLWFVVKRQIAIHAILGLAVFAVMAFLLPSAVVFLYGEGAGAVILPSIILTGAAAINAMAIVFSYTLLALQKDAHILLATGVAACGNVVFNVIAIPRVGLAGAAWSAVVTYALLSSMLAYASIRQLRHTAKKDDVTVFRRNA